MPSFNRLTWVVSAFNTDCAQDCLALSYLAAIRIDEDRKLAKF